jgi:hypothetical protein
VPLEWRAQAKGLGWAAKSSERGSLADGLEGERNGVAPVKWKPEAERSGAQAESCGAEREKRRRVGEGTRPDGERDAGHARKSGFDAEWDEWGAVKGASLAEKGGPRAERSGLPGERSAPPREGSGLLAVKSRFDGE